MTMLWFHIVVGLHLDTFPVAFIVVNLNQDNFLIKTLLLKGTFLLV